MLANKPEAELNTHLVPLVALGLAGAALGAWRVSSGADPIWPTWWPWLGYYGALGMLLFGSSSLFHLAKGTPREERMNVLDHVGIHVMIAGTGTLHMAILPSIQRARVPALLAILWGLALVGISYRVARGDRADGRLVMVIYGLMALTVVPAIAFGEHVFDQSMCFTYGALLAYALSVAVFFRDEALHAWWHLGVVVGNALGGVPIFL